MKVRLELEEKSNAVFFKAVHAPTETAREVDKEEFRIGLHIATSQVPA